MEIQVGQEHSYSVTVSEPMTAEHFGNPGIAVLATPMLVSLVETACIQALAPHIGEGQGSVGTHVDIRHLAATPVGLEVTLTTTVVAAEGRLVSFRVAGSDGIDTICEAIHSRAIINVEKFLGRVASKGAV